MENYKDQTLSFEERTVDLVSKMTLDEKISWCGAWTAAIPRLGIPSWHFSNEASHGINALNYVNDKGYNVTSFPVCLAMSQSWDREKIRKTASAISDEARAAHNIGKETLSFWCPTINLARDPRNGRSDENFGEDPYLAGKLAAAYIQGFQGEGEDPKYIKAAATPKHFMLNSAENNRNTGITFADEKTIREYYGRVFEYAVREGKAQSLMTSYNRINGVPASANPQILQKMLREEWGFDGYVVSDCGAVRQTYNNGTTAVGQKPGLGHYYYNTLEESVAGSMLAGCDMSGGSEHRDHLADALEQGLITEDQIDIHVMRNLLSLFRQGIFDQAAVTPWDCLGAKDLNCEKYDRLAEDMAEDSLVLLKNDRGLLPIRKEGIKKILVVGPNAKWRELGGYSCGKYSSGGPLDTLRNVMTLDGILTETKDDGIEVWYEKGWCAQKERGAGFLDTLEAIPGVDPQEVLSMMFSAIGITKDKHGDVDLPVYHAYEEPEDPDLNREDEPLFARALEKARDADLVIMVAGTDTGNASEGKDRESIALPNRQSEFIGRMLDINPNTVVVLTVMGVIGDPVLDRCHSLLLATYPGQAQGKAIANVLFGRVNPNGKLSTTWYRDDSQLPHINDYAIRKADVLAQDHGRTYWYFDEKPRFPFGYGLHYTSFEYANLTIEKCELEAGESLKASVDVTNTGERDGKEIVQFYIRKVIDEADGEKPGYNKPFRQLKGFEKIFLKSGETKTVSIVVPASDLTFWNNFRNKMRIEPGKYVLEAGKDSKDLPCSASFSITGEWDAPLSVVYAEADRCCLYSGESARMTVTAALADTTRLDPDKCRPVFSSSNEKTACVDAFGTIRALNPGTALITASVQWKGREIKRSVPIAIRSDAPSLAGR